MSINDGVEHTKEVTKRVKMVIALTGLKQKEFAILNDIKLPTLNNWIYGLTMLFTPAAAQRLVEAAAKCGVHVTTTWLLYGTGPQPRAENIIYRDLVKQQAQEKERDFQVEIRDFSNARSDHVVLLIMDDSIEPIATPGDYVGGQLVEDEDIHRLVGRECIAKVEGYPMVCRRLFRSKKGHYELRLINMQSHIEHAFIVVDTFNAIAPLTRVWRQLKLYPELNV